MDVAGETSFGGNRVILNLIVGLVGLGWIGRGFALLL
jgi:hypothetical protein